MQYVPHVSRMAEHVLHGPNEGTLMVNPFATTVDNILPTQAPLQTSRRTPQCSSPGIAIPNFESPELDIGQ